MSFWENVTNAPKCHVYLKKLIKICILKLLSEISDTALLCKWSLKPKGFLARPFSEKDVLFQFERLDEQGVNVLFARRMHINKR